MAPALAWLLRNRDARIVVTDAPAAIRARGGLRDGILELEHGGYRASEIAVQQLPVPSPPPSLQH